jgi:hypothetical protein
MYDSKSVALAFMEEMPNIAAYAYQVVHVWSACDLRMVVGQDAM